MLTAWQSCRGQGKGGAKKGADCNAEERRERVTEGAKAEGMSELRGEGDRRGGCEARSMRGGEESS